MSAYKVPNFNDFLNYIKIRHWIINYLFFHQIFSIINFCLDTWLNGLDDGEDQKSKPLLVMKDPIYQNRMGWQKSKRINATGFGFIVNHFSTISGRTWKQAIACLQSRFFFLNSPFIPFILCFFHFQFSIFNSQFSILHSPFTIHHSPLTPFIYLFCLLKTWNLEPGTWNMKNRTFLYMWSVVLKYI